MANSARELQLLLDRIICVTEKYGIRYVQKKKTMVTAKKGRRTVKILFNGEIMKSNSSKAKA